MSDAGPVSLVGPVLLVAVPGTAASSLRLATASLLVAGSAAASSSDWAAGLTGSLAAMGWTPSGATTDSSGVSAPTFTPWDVARKGVSTRLASTDATAMDRAVSVLGDASPQVADRWRAATSLAADHLRATVAVVAQTGEDPRLGVVVVDLTYDQTPALAADQTPALAAGFPWGQWPSAGARLTQTTSLLVIDEAGAASLLDALTPKVGALLGTDVVEVRP